MTTMASRQKVGQIHDNSSGHRGRPQCRTQQNHLANIYAKLGVASRTEAVMAGLQRQLIKLNE